MSLRIAAMTLATTMLAAAPAASQFPSLPSVPSASGALSGMGGGASSLLGGGLPSVGSTSMGNAAGLLSYCLQNQLVSPTSGASSTLDALNHKPEVTGSSGYSAGQSGTIVAGQGQTLSMSSVSDSLKGKVCSAVLKHAKAMIQR